MSEPTYRVELTHEPDAAFPGIPWKARVLRVADDQHVTTKYNSTREAVFEEAQAAIKVMLAPKEQSSTVYLSEDGDILDPHETQR